ncbi:membrane hypothetical protein [Candidatus Zixiibacteriota bacterium]|nr:membrane hypothetical protein [candidate division Zixibacteria bacterium]
MNKQNVNRLITALGVSLIVFALAIILPKLIIEGPVSRILTTQALEVGLSLIAILFLGRGKFAEYGFRRPLPGTISVSKLSHWFWPGLFALVIGAAASIALLIMGAAGNPIIRQLTMPQILLLVVIFSSTIEEIFTRGFLQGHLEPLSHISLNLIFFRTTLPALISALFFACMHFSLLFSGVDIATMIITLLFTFSLGLLAAHQRARTGSLIPAIGLHMLGNIGGILGGVIFSILKFAISGRLPG